MNLIAWNYRGFGNRRAVQELIVDIVQAQGPMIVFLSETWLDRDKMEWIQCKLKFDGCFTVPSTGWGGGLALLWKEEDMVWVDNFSNYHINVIVHGGIERTWQLTGFYGELETSQRFEGWNMLRMLSSKPKLPWCCFGDFNDLLEVANKKGGAPQSHNLMQSFREVLDDCGYIDLGFLGPEFTWHGKRRGELVWEKLDRGVANCEWKRKPFRFKAMWLMDSGCSDTVARAWTYQTEGTPMFQAIEKLRKCKKMLKKWSRDHFGSVKQQLKNSKEKLWQAEVNLVRDRNDEEVVRLKAELNRLCEKQEQMWHQRSRLQWIKNGDRNTQFFHGTATQRKQKNFIKGIQDSEGRWQSEEDIYIKILVDFCANLFTTSNPQNLDSITEGVQKVVT